MRIEAQSRLVIGLSEPDGHNTDVIGWITQTDRPRKCDNYVSNTRAHRASHEHFSESMKEEPDQAHSNLNETMAARIEIKEHGDPAREREITDAILALDGVIEARIQKGALHVTYDPLATTEKKIEQAILSTGNTVKAAATDTETAHPDLPNSANVEQGPVENAHDDEPS